MRRNENYGNAENRLSIMNGTAAKIIAAAAAAVVILGATVVIGMKDKDTISQAASAPKAESSFAKEITAETTAPVQEAPKAAVSAESKETTVTEKKKTKEPKKVKQPELITTAPAENSVAEYTESAAAAVVQQENGTVDMSVDKMLSMTSSELRALSDDDYEIVLSQAGQAAKYGFKFSAFPDYVFIPVNTGEDDGNSIVVPVTYYDGSVYDYYLSENAEQLELSGNAEIGSGIKIGMTYTEIEEMLGTKLYMANTESSLGRAAAVDIDGRTWLLHFDLTDEQEEELGQRIAADTVYEEVDGVQVRYEQGKANISDMDPVCDLAIYNIHFYSNMADE